ncbi:hypothetical protein PoB_005717700 [Plakobranchus ocellatus]|uniref:Uncharacterized protein n=1 Tax=Plakobranchus ocellatus TaxID=259542 RepID=A0AAV4CGE2_9GAST|nr:hypothetical protein PoB_005717700 [Plakobranchus ocellatus]
MGSYFVLRKTGCRPACGCHKTPPLVLTVGNLKVESCRPAREEGRERGGEQKVLLSIRVSKNAPVGSVLGFMTEETGSIPNPGQRMVSTPLFPTRSYRVARSPETMKVKSGRKSGEKQRQSIRRFRIPREH